MKGTFYKESGYIKRKNIEALEKAWVKLNSWEWDEFIGERPDGFDEMSNDEKEPIITPIMNRIESIIGHASTNRAWWIYELNRSEEEWLNWFINQDAV